MASRKELDKLKREARRQGWDLREGGRSGHIKWIPPHRPAKRRDGPEGLPPSAIRPGSIIVSSSTPSDHRSIKNLTKRLEKAGLEL